MFVLDDNVSSEIVVPVNCSMHPEHSVCITFEQSEHRSAQSFFNLVSSLSLASTDLHFYPLKRHELDLSTTQT